MTRTHSQVRSQIMAVVAVVLVCAWVTAIYDLSRSEATAVREAELRTTTQAQVFAEYSRSTAKRINEVLLDLRSQWNGDPRQFAELVKRRQAHLDDITFPVAGSPVPPSAPRPIPRTCPRHARAAARAKRKMNAMPAIAATPCSKLPGRCP